MYHLGKSIYLWATSKEEYSILLLGLDNAGKTTLLNTLKTLYSTSTSTTEPSHDTTLPISNPKPTVPTVGQNVSTLNLPDMYLKIWDVGGQHSLRSIWTSYYSVCHAIVFVVDSCDVGDGSPPSSPLINPQNLPPSSSKTPTQNQDEEDEDEDYNTAQNPPHSPTITHPITTSTSTPYSTGRLSECKAALDTILEHPSTASIPLLVLANKQDREDCVETVRIKEGLVRRVFETERGGAALRDTRVLPCSALRGDGVQEAVEWVRTRVRWNREGRAPVLR